MGVPIELSTAGITVEYAAEATAGTRPTTGYTAIAGIKSTPDLNPEPSALEVTDLSDTVWKRYISGLKDPGGALAFGANNSEEFQTQWDTFVAAYETAKAAGKAVWMAIVVPGLTKAFFMSVEPAPLGLGAAEVDGVLEVDVYVAPRKIAGWATKPTAI